LRGETNGKYSPVSFTANDIDFGANQMCSFSHPQ
jgi:hypothetical protein